VTRGGNDKVDTKIFRRAQSQSLGFTIYRFSRQERQIFLRGANGVCAHGEHRSGKAERHHTSANQWTI